MNESATELDNPLEDQEIFNMSYWRASGNIINGDTMIDTFYDVFIRSSVEVSRKFVHTDFPVLKNMLLLSITHIARADLTQKNNILEGLAFTHNKDGHDIPPHLYDYWLESLLAAVKKHDVDYDDKVRQAWINTLSPGIKYMQNQH